jgi:hypothetical protein
LRFAFAAPSWLYRRASRANSAKAASVADVQPIQEMHAFRTVMPLTSDGFVTIFCDRFTRAQDEPAGTLPRRGETKLLKWQRREPPFVAP